MATLTEKLIFLDWKPGVLPKQVSSSSVMEIQIENLKPVF